MQVKEAGQLRKEWRKEGNPPCPHKIIETLYAVEKKTDDEACMRCGKIFSPDEVP